MIVDLFECWCTVTYDGKEFIGKTTTRIYKGNGIIECPSCKTKEDYSEDIYSITVCVNKGDWDAIDGEDRVHKPFYDDPTYCIVKECILVSLELKEYEDGIYKMEVYINGRDEDCEAFILDEEKVDE